MVEVDAPTTLCVFFMICRLFGFTPSYNQPEFRWKKATISYYHSGFMFCFIFYVLKMPWVHASVYAKSFLWSIGAQLVRNDERLAWPVTDWRVILKQWEVTRKPGGPLSCALLFAAAVSLSALDIYNHASSLFISAWLDCGRKSASNESRISTEALKA